MCQFAITYLWLIEWFFEKDVKLQFNLTFETARGNLNASQSPIFHQFIALRNVFNIVLIFVLWMQATEINCS